MDDETVWLLLHGTPLTPEVWDGVRPSIEPVHPVLAPQLTTPSSTLGIQTEIAARVLGDIDDSAQRLHVVGHSFGGQVALEVAFAAPARVASLTVVCSRASPFPSFAVTAAALRAGDPLDVDASLGRWFLPGELADDGPVVRYARRCLQQADRGLWADDLDAIAVYDRRADLGSIPVPTSIVAAESDMVATPAEMAAMASAIPGARFECVANASHMSQFTDPAALAARLVAVVGV